MSLRTWSGLAILIATTALATPAFAGSSDTSSLACGSAPAGWNAPKGALVASRGKGPVTAVIDAVGEWRTHIMMSHGPGQYVTHSTMFSPGTNGWPTYCSTPVKAAELEHGYPGASQSNQGAIYQFLYSGSAPVHLAYTVATSGTLRTQAESVADHAWYDMPYQWQASRQNAQNGLYVLGSTGHALACAYTWNGTANAYNCPASWNGTNDGCDCGCQYADPDCGSTSFQRLEYSTYQYKNIESRAIAGYAANNGTQCSSVVADLFYRDTAGAQRMTSYTYSHNQVVAAGNRLYDSVQDECDDGLGFWGGVGASITCFESICDDAARQVRNCFIDSTKCNTDSSDPWNAVVNNPASNAVSISPDRAVGAGLHASGPGGNGPWGGAAAEVAIQWNSPGNVYGCWF